ncbi:MAG: bifunctional diguanylate cyclase/phosphodiesterase [Pseudomonadota bacterium]
MSDHAAPRPPARRIATRLRRWLDRIDWMMLFPAAAAAAWAFGQDAVAMVLVIVLPVFLALNAPRRQHADVGRKPGQSGRAGRVVERAAFRNVLDDMVATCADRDQSAALLLIHVHDVPVNEGQWSDDIGGHVMQLLAGRVAGTLRAQDGVFRFNEDGLAVLLGPTPRTDLDLVMQVVDRVQGAISEGIPLNGRTVHAQSCIGLCTLGAAPEPGGEALLTAAECALRIARRAGDDAVRAFNSDMQVEVETGHRLASQVGEALRDGQIRPWFQPQIDATTGTVAGLEALARWHHPDLGVLTPDRFLPALAAVGLTADLADTILDATLQALVDWDQDGIEVPCIGINLSLEELSDPRLADRIAWQVDRYNLTPHRISVEILETVTLRDGDETVVRNIRALRQAGFRLDLDDFGTGAASIAHIAEFGVHRIKIDRSFVHNLLEDEGRQRVIAAILSLANQLDIATLAEGVETADQQALLSRMGCGQLQGFGIARPMPKEDVGRWMLHRSRTEHRPLDRMAVRGTA